MTAHPNETLYALLRLVADSLQRAIGLLEDISRRMTDLERRVGAIEQGDADADGRADSSIIVDTSER